MTVGDNYRVCKTNILQYHNTYALILYVYISLKSAKLKCISWTADEFVLSSFNN